MALEFYYTDDWKKYLYKDQIAELEPRRIELSGAYPFNAGSGSNESGLVGSPTTKKQ